MEKMNRQDLCDFIYDAHKTAFGTKGRHYDFDSMSMADLEKEADYISEACNEVMAEEAAAEERAIKEFNKEVEYYQLLGAKTREDALRWMLDAEGLKDEYDVGFVQYTFGLPYTYMKEELTAALKEA